MLTSFVAALSGNSAKHHKHSNFTEKYFNSEKLKVETYEESNFEIYEERLSYRCHAGRAQMASRGRPQGQVP